jgi:protein-tyrosine phosphatase
MQPTESSEPTRHLPLPGTYNVRDIGGYATLEGRTVRWRTCFRADSLHRLEPEAQQALIDHGIQTVIDLRRSDEAEAAPNVFARSSHVTYRHLSLLVDAPPQPGTPRPLVETYRHILDERQGQVSDILHMLAAPGGTPAVIHCTAGKDRTGVIVALILALVGVPPTTIIEDYALSSRYLVGRFLEEMRQRASKRGYTWEQYEPLMGCPPEYMQTVLHHLEETHGGVEAYTRSVGCSDELIARLRAALLA